jgi:hypothetical protein
MESWRHTEVMELVVVLFLVVIGPLAVLAGVDSRLDEPRR